VRVTGLDHVVLRVGDPMEVLAWYRDVLGLAPERVEQFEAGEVPFPSVRVDERTVIDLLPAGGEPGPAAAGRPTNMDHLCLVVDGVDLEALAADPRFDVVGGPARLWGAQGHAVGVYVRDPAGNVVELRSYADRS
jgi:catechol 2,3-dioxygenase-like lactoylglutathione lyase family enzyme